MVWTVTKSDIAYWGGVAELSGTTNQVVLSCDLSAWGDGTHHAGAMLLVTVAQAATHQSSVFIPYGVWTVFLGRSTSGWATPVVTKLTGDTGSSGNSIDFVMSGNTLQVRCDRPSAVLLFITVRGPIGESLP